MRFLNTAYIIAHNHTHHKWVATPLDPSSAQKGEKVFSFALRAAFQGQIKSWSIERQRLEKINPDMPWLVKTLRNRVLRMKIQEGLFLSAIYCFWGWNMVGFAFIKAFSTQIFMEITNYVQHYGLRRKEIASGKYERTDTRHSWNASYTLNNVLFFRIARHSDHHETGGKPYQTLQNCTTSPQLPFSMTVAIMLSFNSKVWFEIMDPLVHIYQEE